MRTSITCLAVLGVRYYTAADGEYGEEPPQAALSDPKFRTRYRCAKRAREASSGMRRIWLSAMSNCKKQAEEALFTWMCSMNLAKRIGSLPKVSVPRLRIRQPAQVVRKSRYPHGARRGAVGHAGSPGGQPKSQSRLV